MSPSCALKFEDPRAPSSSCSVRACVPFLGAHVFCLRIGRTCHSASASASADVTGGPTGDWVATVDAFRKSPTESQRASSTLYRDMFTANYRPQNFSVVFTAEAGATYEYRVQMSGTSYTRHIATYVEELYTAKSPAPSMTVTPSPTPSLSASISPSVSPSVAASPTGSPSVSGSKTVSGSVTASVTASLSVSRSLSASSTGSPSFTASRSISASFTASPSISASVTRSATASGSPYIPYQRSYPANSLSHSFGLPNGAEAWAVSTADKNAWAVYGPFATDVPLNTKLCAWFYLSIDNNSQDKHGVAVIDVANRGTVVNQRYLQRQHFNAPSTVQVFSVCFTSPSSSTNIGMEYRVWTPGEEEGQLATGAVFRIHAHCEPLSGRTSPTS